MKFSGKQPWGGVLLFASPAKQHRRVPGSLGQTQLPLTTAGARKGPWFGKSGCFALRCRDRQGYPAVPVADKEVKLLLMKL